MGMDAILEKLKEIIIIKVTKRRVEEDEVIPEAKFIDDLGFDSLETVELIMAMEDEYEIDIPDADAEKLISVGDALKYLKEHPKPQEALPRCPVAQELQAKSGSDRPQDKSGSDDPQEKSGSGRLAYGYTK